MRPLTASLAIGQIGHVRYAPKHHSLRSRIASVLVDIDGNDAPKSKGWVLGVNRPGLVSVYTKDHGRADMTLRDWVEAHLKGAGLADELGRIQVLTTPRILGFAFNPVSVFFAYRQDDTLAGLVFEVSNFHGGRGAYACVVESGEMPDEDTVRFRAEKQFFVSPFNPVAGEYFFRLTRENNHYRLRIQLVRDDETVLTAVHTARLVPLDVPALRSAAWLVASNTARIISAILWEALKLRLKGLAIFAPRRGTIDTMPGRH